MGMFRDYRGRVRSDLAGRELAAGDLPKHALDVDVAQPESEPEGEAAQAAPP